MSWAFCLGPVVNNPAPYLRGPGVQNLAPMISYRDWGFCVFFSVPSAKFQDSSTLKLGLDCYLPIPFQFIIINLTPYHRHYTVQLLKSVVK
jgi:hypothetical protein